MSAIIELWINDEIQSDFWIEKNVIRLGSGGDCDLRIQDASVPSQLGTIRFRNGSYVFYNRSGQPLQIGEQTIESDGSAKWQPSERVELNDEMSLQLRIEGDPRPTPRSDNEVFEQIQEKRHEEQRLKSVQDAEAAKELEQEPTETVSRSSNQKLIGIFLLGLAAIGLLALAAFLMLPQPPSQSGFRATRVVKNLLPHASQLPPRLVQMMQEAQQSVELGDQVMGKDRLYRLQAELDSLKASGVPLTIDQNGKQVGYEKALRAYINEYLAQLE